MSGKAAAAVSTYLTGEVGDDESRASTSQPNSHSASSTYFRKKSILLRAASVANDEGDERLSTEIAELAERVAQR